MSALSRLISRFCYNHPNFGIPNLIRYIILGNIAVFVLDMFSGYGATYLLMFNPHLIVEEFQLWRLITFIFIPANSDPFWFVIGILFYHFLGSLLEQVWGTARFNMYYFLGAGLSALSVLIAYIAFDSFYIASVYYINLSMFLAYATLYPENEIRVYFILSVKTKWLAILYAIVLAYNIVTCAIHAEYVGIFLILISLFNYLIFFWDVLKDIIESKKGHIRHKTSAQTINFKKAQREVNNRKGYLHKCHTCGITDADNPDIEFRYCSKCNGYYCYCSDHINDHTHVQ